jgi:hypothetical protein
MTSMAHITPERIRLTAAVSFGPGMINGLCVCDPVQIALGPRHGGET